LKKYFLTGFFGLKEQIAMSLTFINLPLEIYYKICNSIDSDTDFINLTTTCKYFYDNISQYRPLENIYEMSKIVASYNKYIFKKIIYDFKLLPKDKNFISEKINSITFTNKFSDNIKNIYHLPNIEIINVDFNYKNINSIKAIPDIVKNKNDLILQIISNSICYVKYKKEMDKLDRPDTFKSAGIFKFTLMSRIRIKTINDVIRLFRNNLIRIDDPIYRANINNILERIDTDIEYKYLLMADTKQKYRPIYEIIHNFYLEYGYISIYTQDDDPVYHKDNNELMSFLENSTDLIIDLLKEIKIIYTKNLIYFGHLLDNNVFR
jgi:hypothetical protein